MPFRFSHRRALSLSACLLWLAAPVGNALAQNDASCEARYAEAESAYLEARFEAAIRPLEDCLRTAPLSTDDEARVRRLLAFAYLGRDGSDSSEARRVVENLVAADPAYTADRTRDRPDFVDLVAEVRANTEAPTREPTRRTAEDGGGIGGWVLAAVGVVAVVAAVVLLGGDDGLGD